VSKNRLDVIRIKPPGGSFAPLAAVRRRDERPRRIQLQLVKELV
jgi:hypothetical protein